MKTRRVSLLVIPALLAACVPSTATTWHVPSDCPTIQAGVDSAAVGDTVLVACDTYYEHDIIMKSGVCLTSATGEADCVTIDAQQQGRVIYCLDVDEAASIVGFTMTGGFPTGAASWDSCGGGIYCENSSPTLANCVLLGNAALQAGGGLFCWMSTNHTRTNRTFWRDAPSAVNSGLRAGDRGPTVTSCTFSGNVAGAGGGMLSYLDSPTLTSCTFSGNSADWGGGLHCETSSATLVGCTFSGNSADNSGGGINCGAEASPTLTDCDFSDNTALDDGGALCLNDSSPALVNCKLSANTAGWGGAVFCSGGSPTFEHVEFAGNTAGSLGGGMRFTGSASPTLVNATFSGNGAGVGAGGIDCYDSSVTLVSSIVAFSASGSAIECDGSGSAALSCCDVYGNAGGDWIECIEGQDLVNDNFSEDPLFCDAEAGDFTIDAISPCCAENNPACGLVGAWGIGCDTPVEKISWGAVKAMFR